MDRDEYLDHVHRDGARLIEVARASASAEIPSCPGWDMRALVGHVASVDTWVASILEQKLQARPHLRRVDELVGDFDAIAADYDANFARLVAMLGATPEDEVVWNWSDRAPAPARFWFRRMAHETAIHRVDAELGAGTVTPIEAALAADGIDEFLSLLARHISDEPVDSLKGSIAFVASDVDEEWRLALAPNRVEFVVANMDATVRAPAAALYRWILHRDGGDESAVEMVGNKSVIESWRRVTFK